MERRRIEGAAEDQFMTLHAQAKENRTHLKELAKRLVNLEKEGSAGRTMPIAPRIPGEPAMWTIPAPARGATAQATDTLMKKLTVIKKKFTLDMRFKKKAGKRILMLETTMPVLQKKMSEAVESIQNLKDEMEREEAIGSMGHMDQNLDEEMELLKDMVEGTYARLVRLENEEAARGWRVEVARMEKEGTKKAFAQMTEEARVPYLKSMSYREMLVTPLP